MQTIYFKDGDMFDGADRELNQRAVHNRVNQSKKTQIVLESHKLSSKQIKLLLNLDNTCHVVPMVNGQISSNLTTTLNDNGQRLYQVLDLINEGSVATGVNRIHPAKRTWDMLQKHGGSVKAIASVIKTIGDPRVYMAEAMRRTTEHCIVPSIASDLICRHMDGPSIETQVRNFLKGESWQEWPWVAALLGLTAKERLTNQSTYLARYINEVPVLGNGLEHAIMLVMQIMVSDWISQMTHPELFCDRLLNLPNGNKFQGFAGYGNKVKK